MKIDKSNLQLVTKEQLLQLLTVSSATFWRLQKRPDFPNKIKISNNRIAFKMVEIEEWINRNQVR